MPHDAHGDGRERETRFAEENVTNIVQFIDHITLKNQDQFVQYARELQATDKNFTGAIKTIIDLVQEPSDELIAFRRKQNRPRT